MTELLGMLTSQLGVKEEQASGGAGLLFKLAQEKLGGDFAQVATALPGVGELISNAPSTEATGGAASGLMGMAGSAMSAMGVGGGLGDIAKMAGAVESLGLDMGTIMKFAPIVMEFAQKQGGDEIMGLLSKVLK